MGEEQANAGYLYALLGNTAFALVQILVKEAAKTMTAFQVLYIRSFFLFLLTLGILRQMQLNPYIAQHRLFKLAVIRVGLVGGGQTLVYYCLVYLPVSMVTSLFNLGPIFIFFIEAVAYKKSLNLVSLALTVLSFLGVLLILQPSWLFGSEESKPVKGQQWCVFLMIVSALASAFNFHYIHTLAKRVNPLVNMLYSHIAYIPITGLLINADPLRVDSQKVTLGLLLNLLGIIVSGFIAQYCIFMANSMVKPSKVMPLGYITVACGFLADLYWFKTSFGLLPILGMILTSTGLLTEFLRNRVQATPPQPLPQQNQKEMGLSEIER